MSAWAADRDLGRCQHPSRPGVQGIPRRGTRTRIQLEPLPGYAPELNPDEVVWHTLKAKELANGACVDLPELRQEVEQAIRRLRRRPDVIRGYFREAGYL